MTVMDSFSLKNRVVVITGSQGQIGKALVKAFDEAGAITIPTDISGTEIEMDVTRRKSIRDAFNTIIAKHGRVDVLINLAGIAVFTPFEERTEDEFEEVINVNLKGTLFCCQVFSEQMKLQGGGSIINVGSIYGVTSADYRIYGDSGRNSSEVYAASKAGVIHLTRYLATYLARYNITVNTISPGGIFNSQNPEFVKNYEKKTPMGRMATESDLVGAFIFLASGASGFITGQNICISGGFELW